MVISVKTKPSVLLCAHTQVTQSQPYSGLPLVVVPESSLLLPVVADKVESLPEQAVTQSQTIPHPNRSISLVCGPSFTSTVHSWPHTHFVCAHVCYSFFVCECTHFCVLICAQVYSFHMQAYTFCVRAYKSMCVRTLFRSVHRSARTRRPQCRSAMRGRRSTAAWRYPHLSHTTPGTHTSLTPPPSLHLHSPPP